jgi:Sporulation and spore germination
VHRSARVIGPALFCGGAVAVLAMIGLARTTPAAGRHAVFFLKGEQLVSVMRGGGSVADAMRQLLAGPSTAEKARGLRSYVPPKTTLRRVFVRHGLATVDVSRHFTIRGRVDSRLARLAQLVRTVSGPNTTLPVQLLVEGRKVSGVFPGVPTASPITSDQ